MAVQRERDGSTAQRLIDGLIVMGGDKRIEPGHSLDIRGRDVIAVQAKANRLGMYLMGQAFFSRELLMRMGVRSVKTVAICGKGDVVMEQLCAAHDIEVVVIPKSNKCI